MRRTGSVERYIRRHSNWELELTRLRSVLKRTGLREEIKWGAPCYTHNGKNVVGLAAFRNWVSLWFHQGALLKDEQGVLINAQPGQTKAMRQWRISSASDIKPRIIEHYVKQSIANVDAGREIKAKHSRPVAVPDELAKAMRRFKGATAGFRGLTTGKQNEYADYIASAKRNDTKQRRMEKILPMIAAGVGLNDKYRDC